MPASCRLREGVPAPEPATEPKFFKIILDPRAHTLRIPAEFRLSHGHNLPNHVFLRVPNGSISEVELVQSNDEICLHKGWQEFKERYSIGFGHVLVFEYKGKSQFDVVIFDTTATEIEYPLDANSDANMESNSGKEPDEPVVFLEEIVANKKEKGIEEIKHDISPLPGQQNGRKRRRGIEKETSIAYQKATAFMSHQTRQNPFFICLMQQSYVTNKYCLNVPLTFVKENFPCKKTSLDFTLEGTNGKAWSMKCLVGQQCAKSSNGWKEFAQDNGLEVGDVCIFQVAESTKFVMKVLIFRC